MGRTGSKYTLIDLLKTRKKILLDWKVRDLKKIGQIYLSDLENTDKFLTLLTPRNYSYDRAKKIQHLARPFLPGITIKNVAEMQKEILSLKQKRSEKAYALRRLNERPERLYPLSKNKYYEIKRNLKPRKLLELLENGRGYGRDIN